MCDYEDCGVVQCLYEISGILQKNVQTRPTNNIYGLCRQAANY